MNQETNNSRCTNKVTSFMRNRVLFLLLTAFTAAGCTGGQGEVNRVQTNLVNKDMFTGEWWVNQSVAEADAEDSMEGPYTFFAGGAGWTDYAYDRGQSGVMSRIRWVIDEDFLFAYRSYEIIDGGNDDGDDPNFRGQPIAAFAIEDHVDVRTEYSGLTGEQTNVIVENTSDRRWYERDFMRVDWSTNHVNSFNFLVDDVTMGGRWTMESIPFFIPDDQSHPDFNARFAPQFVRVGEDTSYRFRHEWPEGTEDTVHYMSFTTMTLFSPGQNCLLIGGGRCNTLSVPLRTSFLRIPPEHDFASQQQSHQQFDRFGLFRTYQRSYIRGGAQEVTCETDADCGPVRADGTPSGFCDTETSLCGGLSEDRGETDFMTFLRPVHNIFRDGLTDQACGANFQCTEPGSECDNAAGRCTIPLAQREINPVTYTLNEGYPGYLVNAAYEVLGNWNEVYMRGWRAARGLPIPDYSTGAPIACQSNDPTAYCFCGSAEDDGGSCKTEFNPFVSPAEWTAAGVSDPFDCYIANDSFAEPTNPSSFDEYSIPAVYQYEFRGEECIFLLESNNCDLHRTDASMDCEDVRDENDQPITWQQHGDLRYQFFNYIHTAGVPFGGLSEVRGDAKTGELLASDANVNSEAVDGVRTRAIEWFPVLRCRNPDLGCAAGEENADVRYLEGENLRDYYQNIGRIETPVALAPSGSDGTGNTPPGGRPAIGGHLAGALPAGSAMHDALLQSVVDRMPRIEGLHGEDARFNIHSDRMRSLAGTAMETQFLESLGDQGMQAHFRNSSMVTTDVPDDASITDTGVIEQVSPFRGQSYIRRMNQEAEIERALGARGADFFNFDDADFMRSRYWEYYAEAFRGRPAGEAAIRMAQYYLRAVMHHEMGHSVGLRHNFGGSLDRNNYGDGYFQVAVGDDLPLPQLDDFDAASLGGNADGFVGGSEVNNYRVELDRVREERAVRGAHNHMTASIMDYNGDLSDSYGLGLYDQAAILWSTFGKVEAYVGDPRIRTTNSLDELQARFDDEGNRVARELWSSYEGGEACRVDTDCPMGPGSTLLSDGQPVFQRCIRHPRNTRFQEACRDGEVDCMCSNFVRDFDDYRVQAAYDSDVDGDGELDHFPVNYLFCSDDRTVDISWCTRFDAGESFQETIADYRRNWYQSYATSYNRRFRGVRVGSSIRSILEAAKIYQHLFFRIFFEPGFTSNDGPLGFDDQFSASVDAMNWFIEMVNLPEEGSYALDENNVLRHVSSEVDAPGSDASFGQGMGFGMWSEFQQGHAGFNRVERGGVFWDKYYALLALAIRDWGLSFTVDERYFINFYDLFALPMTEFFGGIITDQPSWYAPRYNTADETVEHMAWYRGLALGQCGAVGARVPCTPANTEAYPVTATEPAIGSTTNVILRSWATILALAQFPVFYDASFEQRLIVWRVGDGIGHNLPDVFSDRRTGVERPYCAYGAYATEPGHVLMGDDPSCTTPEEANYAVYESDRLHFAYAAEKVYTRDSFNNEEEQLGFQMLRRLIDLQDEVRDLETSGANPDLLATKQQELFENESYLEYLIDLQAQYGISNYFF